jgi:hypothetical protein
LFSRSLSSTEADVLSVSNRQSATYASEGATLTVRVDARNGRYAYRHYQLANGAADMVVAAYDRRTSYSALKPLAGLRK